MNKCVIAFLLPFCVSISYAGGFGSNDNTVSQAALLSMVATALRVGGTAFQLKLNKLLSAESGSNSAAQPDTADQPVTMEPTSMNDTQAPGSELVNNSQADQPLVSSSSLTVADGNGSSSLSSSQIAAGESASSQGVNLSNSNGEDEVQLSSIGNETGSKRGRDEETGVKGQPPQKKQRMNQSTSLSSSNSSSSREVITINEPVASDRIDGDEEPKVQPLINANNNSAQNFNEILAQAHNLGYRQGRHEINDSEANRQLNAIAQENSLMDSDLSILQQAYQKGLEQGRNALNRISDEHASGRVNLNQGPESSLRADLDNQSSSSSNKSTSSERRKSLTIKKVISRARHSGTVHAATLEKKANQADKTRPTIDKAYVENSFNNNWSKWHDEGEYSEEVKIGKLQKADVKKAYIEAYIRAYTNYKPGARVREEITSQSQLIQLGTQAGSATKFRFRKQNPNARELLISETELRERFKKVRKTWAKVEIPEMSEKDMENTYINAYQKACNYKLQEKSCRSTAVDEEDSEDQPAITSNSVENFDRMIEEAHTLGYKQGKSERDDNKVKAILKGIAMKYNLKNDDVGNKDRLVDAFWSKFAEARIKDRQPMLNKAYKLGYRRGKESINDSQVRSQFNKIATRYNLKNDDIGNIIYFSRAFKKGYKKGHTASNRPKSSVRGDRGSESSSSSNDAGDANQGDKFNKKRSREEEPSSEGQPPQKIQRMNESMPSSSSSQSVSGEAQGLTMDELIKRARCLGVARGVYRKKLAEQNSQEELHLPEIDFNYVRSLFLNNWDKWHRNGECSKEIQVDNNNEEAVIKAYCENYIESYENTMNGRKSQSKSLANQSSSSSSSKSTSDEGGESLTLEQVISRAAHLGTVQALKLEKKANQANKNRSTIDEVYVENSFNRNWRKWHRDGECSEEVKIGELQEADVRKAYVNRYIRAYKNYMPRVGGPKEITSRTQLIQLAAHAGGVAKSRFRKKNPNALELLISEAEVRERFKKVRKTWAKVEILDMSEEDIEKSYIEAYKEACNCQHLEKSYKTHSFIAINNSDVQNFDQILAQAHNLGYRQGRNEINDSEANRQLNVIAQENGLMDSDLSIIKQAYQNGLAQGRKTSNRIPDEHALGRVGLNQGFEARLGADLGNQSSSLSTDMGDVSEGDKANKKRSREEELSSEGQPPQQIQRMNESMPSSSSSQSVSGEGGKSLTIEKVISRAVHSGTVHAATPEKKANQADKTRPTIDEAYVKNLFNENWRRWHHNGECSEEVKIGELQEADVRKAYVNRYIRTYENYTPRVGRRGHEKITILNQLIKLASHKAYSDWSHFRKKNPNALELLISEAELRKRFKKTRKTWAKVEILGMSEEDIEKAYIEAYKKAYDKYRSHGKSSKITMVDEEGAETQRLGLEASFGAGLDNQSSSSSTDEDETDQDDSTDEGSEAR